jgi:hypothetical protein
MCSLQLSPAQKTVAYRESDTFLTAGTVGLLPTEDAIGVVTATGKAWIAESMGDSEMQKKLAGGIYSTREPLAAA